MMVEFSDLERVFVVPAAHAIAERHDGYVDEQDTRQYLLARLYGPDGWDIRSALAESPQDLSYIELTVYAWAVEYAEREQAAIQGYTGLRPVYRNARALEITRRQEGVFNE
jgi:hypothetical protein